MAGQIPLKYRVFFTGPFNSAMKFDYSQLSIDYDNIRKKLFKKAIKKNTKNLTFFIERFKNSPEEQHQWLQNNSPASNELIFSDPQGKTHRDVSIISAEIKCNIKPKAEIFEKIKNYFIETPVLNTLKLQFHETGIGVFSGNININLEKAPNLNNNQYKDFTKILRDSFTLSQNLQEIIQHVDEILQNTAAKIIKKQKRKQNIIDINTIYPDESIGTPLWGHAVAIMNFNYDHELPFGEATKNLLVVSHPNGIIDMNNLSRGFIHIGWGMSLAVNILPAEIKNLESTMEQLEFYWRSGQILNDLIMKYLEKYSQVKKFTLQQIKKSLTEIEKLTIETELFYSYHMDYIKMLSPLSHFLYQETCKSWRINQMFEYFDSKKDSLSKLHEQGQARIQENIDSKRDKMSNRLNVLLSILALLTLFSWAADSIGFLDATLAMFPSLKNLLIGGKFFVIISTPLLVVAIFFLFFKLTTAMKKIEK